MTSCEKQQARLKWGWALGRADQAGKFIDGDRVDGRHDDASLLKGSWTRYLGMSPHEGIAAPIGLVDVGAHRFVDGS
jgi:hypothetical protein